MEGKAVALTVREVMAVGAVAVTGAQAARESERMGMMSDNLLMMNFLLLDR